MSLKLRLRWQLGPLFGFLKVASSLSYVKSQLRKVLVNGLRQGLLDAMRASSVSFVHVVPRGCYSSRKGERRIRPLCAYMFFR